ncbi:Gfo/Idh/MocA family oxidoreductase [Bacteroides ovatus]|uniref:Gfo/Idh/MocA family oxidoreductase n=1 Tax=Bacteroides ovatus TaxID=28116 RepID=UPI001F214A9C|nr:Gfo/Idh/MocA family oxidoreductase [Bacteroides ovatus]MCE8937794.1 Gfo/Idh/MocA family oxidoreductase [Bacteroides ovatus]
MISSMVSEVVTRSLDAKLIRCSLMKFLGGDKISRRKFLATPDHSYFPICMETMKLGVHVYVEKPLVRTSYECELLMQAEQKYGVITQMSYQGHSFCLLLTLNSQNLQNRFNRFTESFMS